MKKTKKILKKDLKETKSALGLQEVLSLFLLLTLLFPNASIFTPKAEAVFCDNGCGENVCGDGTYEPPYEQCDNGAANVDNMDPVWGQNSGDGDRSYCSTQCQIYYVPGTYCGDGTINGSEQCDGCNLGDYTCETVNGFTGGTLGCNQDCTFDTSGCTFDESAVTIIARKIVCEDEIYLPNWGTVKANGNPINENTVQDFLNDVNTEAEREVCWLEGGWNFQWAPSSITKPDDNINDAGSGWTTFGPTDSNGQVITTINDLTGIGSHFWMREMPKEGYIPFSGTTANPHNNVSAEFYCHIDVLNYDNYDRIDGPVLGETYYCVGFNVPKTCSVVSDITNIVEDGTNAVETWIHSNWTDQSLLDPAKWIWEKYKVLNPTMDETKVFVKKFSLDLIPISATIEVAADNGFILEINGVEIANEIGTEHNYEATKTYPVTNLIAGTNVIRMTVKNFAQSGGTPESNPAGALYNLTVLGSDDCANVEEEPETGSITIYKYYDDNGDGEFNEGDYVLPGWEVSIWADHIQLQGAPFFTNEEGKYVFSNLPLGTYDVCEFIPEGWENTQPGYTPFDWSTIGEGPWAVCYEEAVLSKESIDENNNLNVYFGNRQVGEITVYKEFVLPEQIGQDLSQFCFMVNEDGPYCFDQGSSWRTVPVPYGPYEITEVDPGENWEVSYEGDCEGTIGGGEELLNGFSFAMIMPNGNGHENGNGNGPACTIINTWVGEEEPILGCTNPSATNYNSVATQDDGSCIIRGISGSYARPPEPQGEVLGEATGECGIYLFEYIKYGANNNPSEVKKLQSFLNEHMQAGLIVSGIYDLATMNALNDFQLRYKEQVLKPWVDAGIQCDVNVPTGYVYKTTQRWINLIKCPTLNLPMPDLSGYEKADCEGGEVLGAETTTEEGALMSDESEMSEEEEISEPEEETGESEVLLGEEEKGDEEKGNGMAPIFIGIIVLLAIGAGAWFAFNKMKIKKV